MNKIFSYAAGLILLLAACSQEVKIGPDQEKSFMKFYGNIYQDAGNNVKEVPGIGYAIAGTTTLVENNLPQAKDILFILTDRSGNLLREPQRFGGGGNDYGNSLALTPDGGFALAGTFTDTLNESTDIILLRFDAAGDHLWTRIFEIPGNQTANAVKVTVEDSLFIAGSSDGKYLWLKLADAENSTFVPVISTPGAGAVFTAADILPLERGMALIGYTSRTAEKSSWITVAKYHTGQSDPFAVTPYENIFKEKVFSSCYVNDSTYLVCGTRTGQDGLDKALIRKIGKNDISEVGTVFSQVIDEAGVAISGKCIRLLQDGRIALLATRTINEDSDMALYICSPAGVPLTTILLGDKGVQEAGAFEITSDGGFIITGSNLLDNNSMVSLIKLDAKGKLY
jgi:hypothetical protein